VNANKANPGIDGRTQRGGTIQGYITLFLLIAAPEAPPGKLGRNTDRFSLHDSLLLLNLQRFHLYGIAAAGAKEPEKFIHARRRRVRRAAMRADDGCANFGRQEGEIGGALPDFTA
jgi:hypothetical protein